MKKYIITLFILLFAIALACFNGCVVSQVPPADPICDRPEYSASLICQYLTQAGIPHAETARDMILDANAIALIADVYTVDEVRDLCNYLDDLLDVGGISYAVYFANLVDSLEKAKQAQGFIKRHFGGLNSNLFILPADRELIRIMIQRVRESSDIN